NVCRARRGVGTRGRGRRRIRGARAARASRPRPVGRVRNRRALPDVSRARPAARGVGGDPLAGAARTRGRMAVRRRNGALLPLALLARLSLPLTKAVWAIGNVALFGWCLVRGYRHAGRWTPVVLAVAAIAQPLQSNFQHLNINLVLLALVTLAIADLEQAREMRAALWIGVATALKGYPGGVFLYFLARGRWRPPVVGVTVAVALSFLVVLPA